MGRDNFEGGMTYGAKTWHMTVKLAHRLHVTQRAMQRSMLGVTLRGKIQNEVIRQKNNVTDIGNVAN